MKVYKSCPHCSAVLKLDSTANGLLTCPKCSNKSHTRDMKELPTVECQCPGCNANLRCQMLNKNVKMRCPQCSYEDTIEAFRLHKERNFSAMLGTTGLHDGETEINNPKAAKRDEKEDEKTCLAAGLKTPANGHTLSLRLHSERGNALWYGSKVLPAFKEGRQIIGRAGKGADIECPTRDLYFSRQHFAVEVEYLPRQGIYRHILCYNGHKNRIMLNPGGSAWIEVKEGDMPILNVGDLICVGETILEVFDDKSSK